MTFGFPKHMGVSSRRVSGRRKKLGRVVRTETEECTDQAAGQEVQTRGQTQTNISTWMTQTSMISRPSLAETLLSQGASGGQSDDSVSTKRACEISPPVSEHCCCPCLKTRWRWTCGTVGAKRCKESQCDVGRTC